MPKTKPLSFNLCDFDDLDLTFTNSKGEVIYSLDYTRAELRKGALDSPTSVESIHFSAYKRTDNFTSHVEVRRPARLFASSGKALRLARRLRVDSRTDLRVELYGAGGALLAHANITGARLDHNTFTANGESGSLHAFTALGRDPEQTAPRRGER
jgi:hypothetical protein